MNDPFTEFIGKTVASVEASDREFLITFTDSSEIAVTLDPTDEFHLEITPTRSAR